jgi:hypothetical protein
MDTKLKTEYEFITFTKAQSTGITSKWYCLNKKSGFRLGMVEWYGALRQYCFCPVVEIVLSSGCLIDIQDFIKQLMNERKKK